MQSLLIVQGGSAVGKTTLAKRLAKDLNFLLLTKDNFKELFYDTLGTPPTRDESTVYGLAATKALYASAATFLDNGETIIIESAFTKGRAEPDVDKITADKDLRVIQVYVTASPKIRLERYEARIARGERHAGHPDGSGVVSENHFRDDHTKFGALDIDDTIEVNTDMFHDDDYNKLLSSLKQMIGDN